MKLIFTAALTCFISFYSIAQRKQIPILCYHQIRDWRPADKKADKDYIIPPANFRAHMKMLADSGYHTILPDQLYDYLTKGLPLPAKPIMLTFDDTDADQFNQARPELLKYGFKGVYFIVWNNIAKNKGYMSRAQVRQLAAEGNIIACHTLTHRSVNLLKAADWASEITSPTKKLELLTGKPVRYFAFPYGQWNIKGLPGLHQQGFKAAFQLDQPRDPADPLMTIRRVIDCGYWDTTKLDYMIKHGFGQSKSAVRYAAGTASVNQTSFADKKNR